MITLSKNNPFLIAEIGHNHQGDIKKAFQLFETAKSCGAHAVKLQKRNNKLLYTKKFYKQIYNSENSFGKTYGEHREFLEFNENQYKELKSFAKKLNIFFFATAFDFKSVEFLEKIDLPAYKIASADLLNFPLQDQIAKTNKLIFLSTGGGNLDQVRMAVENICKNNNNLVVMQCTSSYPVDLHEMNLNVISTYKKEFPNLIIGLSDHENGIDAAPLAYMLGARVFEKHFTLDRTLKGSDHAFSLEPQGLAKLSRNLKRINILTGSFKKKQIKSEKIALKKMKKYIVASKNLKPRIIIKKNDISLKVSNTNKGLTPDYYYKIIGKKLKKKKEKEENFFFQDLDFLK